MRNWVDVVRYLLTNGANIETYNYVTALRGIDIDFSELPSDYFSEFSNRSIFKMLTVAILRGNTINAFGIQNTIDLLDTIEEQKSKLEEILRYGFKRSPHFKGHFVDGLSVLKRYYWRKGYSILADVVEKMIIDLYEENFSRYLEHLKEYVEKWQEQF